MSSVLLKHQSPCVYYACSRHILCISSIMHIPPYNNLLNLKLLSRAFHCYCHCHCHYHCLIVVSFFVQFRIFFLSFRAYDQHTKKSKISPSVHISFSDAVPSDYCTFRCVHCLVRRKFHYEDCSLRFVPKSVIFSFVVQISCNAVQRAKEHQ